MIIPSTCKNLLAATLAASALAFAGAACATPFVFSTGDPDGKIAIGSRPSSTGKIEIESADDFILSERTRITKASFTGLLPDFRNVGSVVVEIYRVFPFDSTNPPSDNVTTRVNSPSDVAFDTRSSGSGLSFATTVLNGTFTAANSVLNRINPIPNEFTGGDGAVSGQEVRFDVAFTTQFDLPAGHYFFIPQVQLTTGDFLWLSAPKPIAGGTGPFAPDLQSWIRNQTLSPDWLRVGTDITHQGPFNAAFSLEGATVAAVPEPESYTLMLAGLALVGVLKRRRIARPS